MKWSEIAKLYIHVGLNPWTTLRDQSTKFIIAKAKHLQLWELLSNSIFNPHFLPFFFQFIDKSLAALTNSFLLVWYLISSDFTLTDMMWSTSYNVLINLRIKCSMNMLKYQHYSFLFTVFVISEINIIRQRHNEWS